MINLYNTEVPSSDVYTSLYWYSSVSKVRKVFVCVNGGADMLYRYIVIVYLLAFDEYN